MPTDTRPGAAKVQIQQNIAAAILNLNQALADLDKAEPLVTMTYYELRNLDEWSRQALELSGKILNVIPAA